MKRDARRACGFGCVICGLPLYEYDHIVPYAVVEAHAAANLTLLCPTHHAEKTRGLLSQERVIEASNAPHNLNAGRSSPFKLLDGTTQIHVFLGSNHFIWDGPEFRPVVVDGITLIGVEVVDGHALLNAKFFDEVNRPILEIVRSEIVYTPDPWDIEFVGQVLTVRSAPGEILLRLRFDAENPCPEPMAHRSWISGARRGALGSSRPHSPTRLHQLPTPCDLPSATLCTVPQRRRSA
jgi:hypothetical protein